MMPDLKDYLREAGNNKPVPAPKNRNRSRIVIEPSDEERAARDIEIQQRGGRLHDKVKMDPFADKWKWPVHRDPVKRT